MDVTNETILVIVDKKTGAFTKIGSFDEQAFGIAIPGGPDDKYGSVSGTVKSSSDKLLGAINVSTGIYSAKTNVNGKYLLDKIIANDYKVKAEVFGFKSQIKDAKVTDSKTTILDYTLEQDVTEPNVIFFESFETSFVGKLPKDWNQKLRDVTNLFVVKDGGGSHGNNSLYIDEYENCTKEDGQRIIFPEVDLTGYQNVLVSFVEGRSWDYAYGRNDGHRVKLEVSDNKTGPWTTVSVFPMHRLSMNTWTLRTSDLSKYSGKKVYLSLVTMNAQGTTWYLDEIKIKGYKSSETGTITGTIKTEETGEAVQGVEVVLTENMKTTTDASGKFSFSNVSIGKYQLTVKKDGFITKKAFVLTKPKETANIDFTVKKQDYIFAENFDGLERGILPEGWTQILTNKERPFYVMQKRGLSDSDCLYNSGNALGNKVIKQQTITPEIDLTGATEAFLTFSESRDWEYSVASHNYVIEVSESPTGPWKKVKEVTFYKKDFGKFVTHNDIYLHEYAGKKIYLAFSSTRKGFHTNWYIDNVIVTKKSITSVDEEETLPVEYSLQQNYPNPFNPETTIAFTLPENERVKIKIYDVLGREVNTIIDKEMPSGKHEVKFNALNYASGVYFYRLEAGNFIEVKKMILLK